MVHGKKGMYRFRLVCPGAERVYLVGDFTAWSRTAIEMSEVRPGVWQTDLRLEPGTYRFRYHLDDGRWVTDFAAFGITPNRIDGWDSVLWVPEPVYEQPEPRASAAV